MYTEVMSLAIAIKVPEGLVLAAESRVTYTREEPTADPNKKLVREFTFDNATKLLSFDSHNYVGAVTYDIAEIGDRTANSFVPEFLATLGDIGESDKNRLTIENFAKKLSDFYLEQWQNSDNATSLGKGQNMRFLVGGFDTSSPYAKVFEVVIPEAPKPKAHSVNSFDILWGGQREIVDRVINGIDGTLYAELTTEMGLDKSQLEKLTELRNRHVLPVIPRALALQDSIKLALTIIRTTIDFQTLAFAPRGVGGPIDIATITKKDGFQPVQIKKINGEEGNGHA